jgi:hypothetical protein
MNPTKKSTTSKPAAQKQPVPGTQPKKKVITTKKTATKNVTSAVTQPNRKAVTTKKTAQKNVPTPATTSAKKRATPDRRATKSLALPSLATQSEMEDTSVEISTRAYFIFLSEGSPPGRDLQHWLNAEAQLRNQ